jgi:hypothetical protein
VEAFLAPDPEEVHRYSEFEVAPNGERLDVRIDLPDKDFAWQSGMESAVKIDPGRRIWRAEIRIPLNAIHDTSPSVGTRWRANFYRHDAANQAFLAWSPTLTRTAHTPEKFGWLEFVDQPGGGGQR